MRSAGFTLTGFCVALLCLTLFSSFATLAVFLAFGGVLYSLFFAKPYTGVPLLVGLTVGLELLGNHRFGIVTLIGVMFYGLYLLFYLQLRFTSPYSRFIVALALGLIVATFLLYPLREVEGRFVAVGLALAITSGAGALLQRSREPSSHELL